MIGSEPLVRRGSARPRTIKLRIRNTRLGCTRNYDDAVARLLYAGEARETAKTLMKHQNSKIGRRFKRLREELSSRTAGRDL